MNKKVLFAFTLLTGLTFGQFTEANQAAIGATQVMYQIDSSASNYSTLTGNSGVTWDYSSFGKFPNGTKNYSIVANTNFTDYGASTNQVSAIEGVLSTFLETNSTSKKIVGIEYVTGDAFLGTVKINFNGGTKIDVMNYPFAYNDQITSACSGNLIISTSTTTATGPSVSKFDGIGTLKLANGVTLNNISRHHTNINITSIVNILPVATDVDLTIDQYDYYDLSTGDFLPEFSYVKVDFIASGGVNTSTSLNFALSTSEPTGNVSLNENKMNQFSIFPNPTKNTLSISSELFTGNEVFEVSTLEGRIVLNAQTNEKIDVSSLQNGTYFITTEMNGEKVAQKFIKE
jgi:hypothetical protein